MLMKPLEGLPGLLCWCDPVPLFPLAATRLIMSLEFKVSTRPLASTSLIVAEV